MAKLLIVCILAAVFLSPPRPPSSFPSAPPPSPSSSAPAPPPSPPSFSAHYRVRLADTIPLQPGIPSSPTQIQPAVPTPPPSAPTPPSGAVTCVCNCADDGSHVFMCVCPPPPPPTPPPPPPTKPDRTYPVISILLQIFNSIIHVVPFWILFRNKLFKREKHHCCSCCCHRHPRPVEIDLQTTQSPDSEDATAYEEERTLKMLPVESKWSCACRKFAAESKGSNIDDGSFTEIPSSFASSESCNSEYNNDCVWIDALATQIVVQNV